MSDKREYWTSINTDTSEEILSLNSIKSSSTRSNDEFELLTTDHHQISLDSPSIQSTINHSTSDHSIETSQSSRFVTLKIIENFVLDIIKQIHQSNKNKNKNIHESSSSPSIEVNSKAQIVALLKDRSSLNPNKYHKLTFPKTDYKRTNSASGARALAQLLRVLELSHFAILRNVVLTKRDVFYNDVNLFKNQRVVDQLVDDLAATFNVTRGQLHLTGSPKGLFQGNLEITNDKQIKTSGNGPAVLIPPSDTIKQIEIHPDLQFILIIEKEAIFNLLVALNFANDARLGRSILICGIGYPNLATRQLVHRLSEEEGIKEGKIRLEMLVDCDPHGVDIAKVYKFGSQSMAFHPGLCAHQAHWLGVKTSDWSQFDVDLDLLSHLTTHDADKINQLLKIQSLPDDWRNELRIMKKTGKKSEIEILNSTQNLISKRKRRGTDEERVQDPEEKNKEEEEEEEEETMKAYTEKKEEDYGLIPYLLKKLSS